MSTTNHLIIKARRGIELQTRGWQHGRIGISSTSWTKFVRHADAGYDLAIRTAKEKGIQIPSLD